MPLLDDDDADTRDQITYLTEERKMDSNNLSDDDYAGAVVTDAGGDRIRATLVRTVEAATGLPWDVARRGFEVTDMTEDETAASECVCGQTGLRYLYTIEHRDGAVLYAIGSDCIHHFGVVGMVDKARTLRHLHDVAAVVARGEHLTLRGPGRNLTAARLLALYDSGAFAPTPWNGGDPANDYDFMLRMMRKRNGPSGPAVRKIASLLGEIERFVTAASMGGAA